MDYIVRKLNDAERLLVEQNHNLIYDFIHARDLELSEYYGLIAESLCKTAMYWDKEKGAFSTLFYQIATRDLYAQWRRMGAMKRMSGEELPLEEGIVDGGYDITNEYIASETMKELMNSEYANIIRLRLDGYTQEEIAIELGVTQATISRKLAEVGERYFN